MLYSLPEGDQLKPTTIIFRRHARTLLTLALVCDHGTGLGAQPGVDQQRRRLTLGEAIRLAAQQSTLARVAQVRVEEAQSRVAQRRADLLPNLSASLQQGGRTFNTA